jgi:membrane-associated protein
MEYRQFLFFNVFGGISWVVSMVLAGRFLPELINPLLQPILGEQFHVAEHIEKVVVLIVILSVLPMIIGWAKGKLARTEKPLPPEAHAAVSEPALSVK